MCIQSATIPPHERPSFSSMIPKFCFFSGLTPILTGPIVRIAPNHASISDPAALHLVYAHGNGSLKSNFYDAFVSIQRGLFNTRDRSAHARKRKIVSHIFSQKSVLEFEPYVREYVKTLIQQWDRLYDLAIKGMEGPEGEGGWKGRNGRLWLDCLPCGSLPLLISTWSSITHTRLVDRVQLSCI